MPGSRFVPPHLKHVFSFAIVNLVLLFAVERPNQALAYWTIEIPSAIHLVRAVCNGRSDSRRPLAVVVVVVDRPSSSAILAVNDAAKNPQSAARVGGHLRPGHANGSCHVHWPDSA